MTSDYGHVLLLLENEVKLWRSRACAWKTKDGIFVSGHDVVMHRYEDGSHLNFFACDLTKSQQQFAYFAHRKGECGDNAILPCACLAPLSS